MFDFVEPRQPIPVEEAASFDCRRSTQRDPRQTKGRDYRATSDPAGPCCGGDEPCC